MQTLSRDEDAVNQIMWQYIDTNLQKNELHKIAREIILHSYSRGGLASNLKVII